MTEKTKNAEQQTESVIEARNTFAKNLKRIRKSKGFVQGDLGHTQAFISNVERARSTLTLDNIALIAETLDTPIVDFLKK